MTAKPAKATPSTLQSENLQGHEVSANDPDALREAIELAFNYRGDVMITGKDTASGKTFENWIRKYAQKKLAGETASIESESLDED